MTQEECIRISMHSRNEVHITGLANGETNFIIAAIEGGFTAIHRGSNGRLVAIPRFQVPPAVDDEKMLPFWREFDPKREGGEIQTVFDLGEDLTHNSPSITIQHLCGYNYTPEDYKRQSELLERWGFECLRSRRGDDGKYWEMWVLSGLWRAKGELKNAIGTPKENEALKKALLFLARNASFGTLDVSVQRLGMRTPD